MEYKNKIYITLDLNLNELKPVIIKQYNKESQLLIITVTERGKQFLFDGTMQCRFKMLTPDHRYIYQDAIINENHTVTVLLTESISTHPGTGKAELQIVNNSDQSQIATMNFIIRIEGSVYDNEIIESSSDFSALTKLVTENKTLNDNLTELNNRLEENESIRQYAESERQTNETNRVSAESDRQTASAAAVTNANTAANKANTAKEETQNATLAANTAAQNAKKATQEANTAVQTMNDLMKSDNILHMDDFGVPGGVATLDENGNIPSSQLPGFVDDVLEGTAVNVITDELTGAKSASGFILTGETETCIPESGKIYVDIDESITYRWSGSIYVTISSPLALGTTSATAFPGNRGLTLENKIKDIEDYHNSISASDIKFDNSNTALTGANVQSAIENLTQTATTTKDGLLSYRDKKKIDDFTDFHEIPITLAASSWTGSCAPYSQIVSVSSLADYNNCSIELSPDVDSNQSYAAIDADISDISYDPSFGLTFIANGRRPETDIPLILYTGTSLNTIEVPAYIDNLPVTGIKGNCENSYRTGNVNIMPDHIGALSVTGDSANNIISFTNEDAADPVSWTDVSVLESGQSHHTLFKKISCMFKNIRWLYKMLGTADISTIGNGTVTGAVNEINSGLAANVTHLTVTAGGLTGGSCILCKTGKNVIINFAVYYSGVLDADTEYLISDLPDQPVTNFSGTGYNYSNSCPVSISAYADGTLKFVPRISSVPANTYVIGQISYITNN